MASPLTPTAGSSDCSPPKHSPPGKRPTPAAASSKRPTAVPPAREPTSPSATPWPAQAPWRRPHAPPGPSPPNDAHHSSTSWPAAVAPARPPHGSAWPTRYGHADSPDLGDGLRTLYTEQQTSIEALAAELGISKGLLRRTLAEHTIALRPAGTNTDAGRRSRTQANIARAAKRVGTTDLYGWLHQRRRDGWPLAKIANAVKRSIPWVSARIAENSPCQTDARASSSTENHLRSCT